MCDFVCAMELSSLLVALLSFPIYVLFLCMLFKQRHSRQFCGTFYHILRALGLADLITISHYYIFLRTLRWNLLMPLHLWGRGSLVRYYVFVVFGGQRCQQLLVLVATINRYIAIVRPETVWTVRYTTRATIMCGLIAWGSYLNIPLFCQMGLIPVSNGSHLWPSWPQACWVYSILGTSLLTFAMSALFIIAYARMFYVAWHKAKTEAASQVGGSNAGLKKSEKSDSATESTYIEPS